MKEIEAAIEYLAKKVKDGVSAPEAMNYAQAALNLAHVQQVLKQVEKS